MRRLLLGTLLFNLGVGCAAGVERHEPLAPAAAVSEEQRLVDAATLAVRSMRQSGNFPSFEYFAERSRGVLIFPNLVKAALLFGGEGGKGVLLARDPSGAWSAPAFYSLGAGSIGLQIGYQRATVVLFLMNEHTLLSVIDRGLTLGADASVAAGTIGTTGRSVAATLSSDVVQLVESGGLFAGLSLDGAVLDSRERDNRRYYGAGASTLSIVLERRFDHAGATTLRQALSAGR